MFPDFHSLSFFSILLLIISFGVCVLFIERLLFFATLKYLPRIDCGHIQKSFQNGSYPDECPHIRSSALKEAINLLFAHKNQERHLRKEVLNHWLIAHRTQIFTRLRLLSLLGFMAILIGFLGSVLGGIKSLSMLTSLEPHQFIPQLKESLSYAAFGLIIAIPSFILVRLFRIWGDYYLQKMQTNLDILCLSIEGAKI